MHQTKIGVFGSAFNPPTLGHLDVLTQAADEFDRVLLVPSACHAFAKQLLPFITRVEMLERFIFEARSVLCEVEICQLEVKMLKEQPDSPVYTFDLMERLEKQYPENISLGFIRGPDNAEPETWKRFYKADQIEQRWPIFTARERVNARSSLVRELLSSQTTGDKTSDGMNSNTSPQVSDKKAVNVTESLDRLLLPSVKQYILEKGLYR